MSLTQALRQVNELRESGSNTSLTSTRWTSTLLSQRVLITVDPSGVRDEWLKPLSFEAQRRSRASGIGQP